MFLGLVNLGLALINYILWREKKQGFSLFACGFCLAAGASVIARELMVQ